MFDLNVFHAISSTTVFKTGILYSVFVNPRTPNSPHPQTHN